jgi:GNAT superfamily N-acetyltransferase
MLIITDLREAPEHLPKLAAWHHAQWSHLYPGQTLAERTKTMQSHLCEGIIPSTYVAIDHVLLGSASIIENDMETHPELTPWLASVYVDKPYRNQGTGHALVKHVIDTAANSGIRRLYLFTPDRQSFYRGIGWQYYGSENYLGEDVTIMYHDTH